MKVKAHGKIILIGEHSVVYGKPAIAMPFYDTKMEASTEKFDQNFLEADFFSGPVESLQGKLKGFKHLLDEFFQKFNIKENIKIKIKSNIPLSRGMGSSAAAAVVISNALYQHFNIKPDIEDIIDLANVSEKHIHGNPSGIDIKTIAYDMPIWYVRDKEMEVFPIDLDAYLLIGDSGKEGSTKEAVEDLRKLYDSDNQYREYIEDLGQFTKEARSAIEKKDINKLGQAMNMAHQLLAKLSVSDEILDKMVDTASKAGALGAKLTGGGRGGCMIALAKDKDSALKIKKALENLGKDVWISKLKEED